MSKPKSKREQSITSEPSHVREGGITKRERPADFSDRPADVKVGPIERWQRFWFTPKDPIGLHFVRVLACVLFLAWLLPLSSHREAFFGLNGWIDQQAFQDIAADEQNASMPLDQWSVFYLCGQDSTMISVIYWASIAAIVLFGLGIAPRVTSVLTWVAVLSCTANPLLMTDVDVLLVLVSFYLMIGYVLLGQMRQRQSYFSRILGPTFETWLFQKPKRNAEPKTSIGANVALRLLQIHVALVICVSGLHKLGIGDWLAGQYLWYPLHPPFTSTMSQVVADVQSFGPQSYFFLLSLATYCILAWQLAFPLFAWRRGLRWLLLGGAVIGFIGSAAIYGELLFGFALVTCSLSFLAAEQWRRVLSWIAQLGTMLQSNAERSMTKDSSAKVPVSV